MTSSLPRTLALGVIAFAVLSACGGGDDAPASVSQSLSVAADGITSFDTTRLATTLQTLPLEPLSADERASLAYLREEEKLAHDVYVRLSGPWGAQARVFSNIARSEATHTEAVRQLLQRYALPDPAQALPEGVFTDAGLQALYVALVDAGSASLIDALRVGAAVEEIDLLDLEHDLGFIDNADIRQVYLNLAKGSRNHLRAFVAALLRQGQTYEPQYLASEAYEAIISTPTER